MKKSKYLGMKSGDWSCTHVGVADVQPAFCRRKLDADGKKARTKSRGSMQYFYIFERPTSDQKAMKHVQLNASQACRVRTGKATVEQYAEKKKSLRSQAYKDRVSYSFCD